MSTLKVNHIIPFSTNEITMVSASLTGSITNADSASYALTASFIPGATSASYVELSNVDGFTDYSSSVNNSISDVRDLIAPAIFTTIPTTLTSSVFQTLIVSGSNFDSEAISYVLDSNGTRRNPTTSARTSTKNITLTFSGSDALSAVLDPYSVVVENGSGLSATKTDIFNISVSPVWETEAGLLGTINAGEYITASFFVSASDADGTQPTYSIVSGALPQGLTFVTSSGEITGSSIIPADSDNAVTGSGVNFNFTISATDNTYTVPRSFYINKQWVFGSQALPYESALWIRDNLGYNTAEYNDFYWIDLGNGQGASYVYCIMDADVDGGGWMVWYGTPSGNTSDTYRASADRQDTSSVPITGNYSLNYARRSGLTAICSENKTLLYRGSNSWLRYTGYQWNSTNHNSGNYNFEFTTDCTTSNGTTDGSIRVGLINYNNSGGGDYGIGVNSLDHHSNGYYHLNGGCSSQYLYQYGSGYKSNTGISGFGNATAGCTNDDSNDFGFLIAQK